MKRNHIFLFVFACLLVCGLAYIYVALFCGKADVKNRVVVCVPVYGQSLALGEEAKRVTDLDELKENYFGRVVTENIDYNFGYFDHSYVKQAVKKLIHYKQRDFELSVYGMSELLASHLGNDTIICTFPGGQGETELAYLCKGSIPYQRFLDDIEKACSYVQERGGVFYVPAVCWMQGESNIEGYSGNGYKELFLRFCKDLNEDIKAITDQKDNVRMVCYQPNSLSRGDQFDENSYECEETVVPQAFVELIRTDSLFCASGPTYPYNFINEAIHIDGIGQKRLGSLAGMAVESIIHHKERFRGVIPLTVHACDSNVVVHMNVPCPPLLFDTIEVEKIDNYGFKVVDSNGRDVLCDVKLDGSSVILKCNRPSLGCKVRYAVNGEKEKSGRVKGPRGNLRDSQGDKKTVVVKGVEYPLHNWCYQFDELVINSLSEHVHI